jgi:acetyl-CoA carboxylase carboxyltransferase component
VQPGPDNPRWEASRARHVARGKLLARDRIDALLDRGSPFLELAPLAACDLGDDWPAAGSSPASASWTGAT